jgi:hypothetical protein
MPTTLQLFPPAAKRVYCSYVGTGGLTEAVVNTGAYYQFRLNSVYDPDYTGAGSTAIGFAALANAYSTFRVVRVRVILSMNMVTSGSTVVGFIPSFQTTLTSNYALLEGEPGATTRMLCGASGSRSVATFDKVLDMARVACITPQQYMDDMGWAHTNASNPARGLFLTVFMAGNTASTVQSVAYRLRLIYDLEVSTPTLTMTN